MRPVLHRPLKKDATKLPFLFKKTSSLLRATHLAIGVLGQHMDFLGRRCSWWVTHAKHAGSCGSAVGSTHLRPELNVWISSYSFVFVVEIH
jgi:hypothetical protein